ncbi:TPA: hypothetical protein ACPWQK_006774, partial [Pseudomonas aeruginosa]
SSFMGPQDGTYRLLTAAAVRLDISWPVVLPPASQQESPAWMMGPFTQHLLRRILPISQPTSTSAP